MNQKRDADGRFSARVGEERVSWTIVFDSRVWFSCRMCKRSVPPGSTYRKEVWRTAHGPIIRKVCKTCTAAD